MNNVHIISSRLIEKNSKWHIIVSYSLNGNKAERKWISTGLSASGNKRKAKQILEKSVQEFKDELLRTNPSAEILFSDYMIAWLEKHRVHIQDSTYCDYRIKIHNQIVPYFKSKKIRLNSLSTADIDGFYRYLQGKKGLLPSTVRKFHANIHLCLEHARQTDKLIFENPARDVILPKKEKTQKKRSGVLNLEEQRQLLNIVSGSDVETPINLAIFLGLRRSETIGVKWSDIDFENNIVSICRKASVPNRHKEDEKYKKIVIRDIMKNASSCRTAILPEPLKDYLQKLKMRISENKSLFGNCYHHEYSEYVCVRKDGSLPPLDFVTRKFEYYIKKLKLNKKVTFHGLRHSYASFLLHANIPMKTIQVCLGHSNITTTMDIYAHLDINDKIGVADTISRAFSD